MSLETGADHVAGALELDDWNEFLHALRTRELATVELPGPVALSVGAAGRWYFDWFSDNVKGRLDRHIGVEAFADRPADLPAEVEWVSESIGRGTSLRDSTVDLVFAGQAIEHCWPEEVVVFLTEAWRLLRPGGALVLDSPNRTITEALSWFQPEHTVEFTPGEIAELLHLSGFDLVDLRGIWDCVDRESFRYLPLEEPDRSRRAMRISAAERRPADAFVWWAEAERSTRPPDTAALQQRVLELSAPVIERCNSRGLACGHASWAVEDGCISLRSRADESGLFRHGPYVPLHAGNWVAEVDVRNVSGDVSAPALRVEVVCGYDAERTLADRTFSVSELCGRAATLLRVPFTVAEQVFAVQVRLWSFDGTELVAKSCVPILSGAETVDSIRLMATLEELEATRRRRSVRAADSLGAGLGKLRHLTDRARGRSRPGRQGATRVESPSRHR